MQNLLVIIVKYSLVVYAKYYYNEHFLIVDMLICRKLEVKTQYEFRSVLH